MKRGRFLWLLLVAVSAVFWGMGAEPFVEVFDQEHADSDAYELFHNIEGYEPVGQSFLPEFGALDVVDLWLLDIGSREDGDGSTVKLRLRVDGLEGEALAESAPARIPDGWDGVVRFEFAKRIQLERGRPYCMELIHVEGEPAAVRNYGELFEGYERGELFLRGVASGRSDMWFRTGVVLDGVEVVDVAVDGLTWKGVPPLKYEVWESVDLMSWALVDRVGSDAERYAFSFPAGSFERRFFQVRFSRVLEER